MCPVVSVLTHLMAEDGLLDQPGVAVQPHP